MGPGAEMEDRTAGAVGPLGLADSATMEDEKVGNEGPFLSGNDATELLLNLVLLIALREAQPVGQSGDVGVHGDPLVDAERVAEHDVGRLAPDAGKYDQRLHGSGYLPAMLLDQHFAAANDVPGPVSMEPGRVDHLFYH